MALNKGVKFATIPSGVLLDKVVVRNAPEDFKITDYLSGEEYQIPLSGVLSIGKIIENESLLLFNSNSETEITIITQPL